MKRILFIGVVIVFFVIANNLVHNIFSLWQKQQVVDQAARELVRVTEENKKLKSQLGDVQRPNFIEEEARNKLFYTKPDERIVFVPQDVLNNSTNGEDKGEEILSWKAWMALFF